jgi:hypothetical protein
LCSSNRQSAKGNQMFRNDIGSSHVEPSDFLTSPRITNSTRRPVQSNWKKQRSTDVDALMARASIGSFGDRCLSCHAVLPADAQHQNSEVFRSCTACGVNNEYLLSSLTHVGRPHFRLAHLKSRLAIYDISQFLVRATAWYFPESNMWKPSVAVTRKSKTDTGLSTHWWPMLAHPFVAMHKAQLHGAHMARRMIDSGHADQMLPGYYPHRFNMN